MVKIPDSYGVYELGVTIKGKFEPVYLDYSDNSLRWAYYTHHHTYRHDNHVVGAFFEDPSEVQFRYYVVQEPRKECIKLVSNTKHGNGRDYVYLMLHKVKGWKEEMKGVERHHTNRIGY